MSELMKWLWQFNLELSLLLICILLARTAMRKFTGNYNNYLLWLSIPLAIAVSKCFLFIQSIQPISQQVSPMQATIRGYIVQPAENFDAWLIVGAMVALIASLLLLRLMLQHRTLRRELNHISVDHGFSIPSTFPIIAVAKDGFSPAVYGFLKPAIYFPVDLKDSLTAQQIELIIQHEEQHVKQGHLWLNLFWDILVCLLWFNPLVYFARQSFRHDQELYCDYLVLKNSDPHGQRSYGHALLSTVSATHSVSLLCSWKMFNQLEERIMNIKSTFNTPKKLLLTLSATLLVCGASAYSLAMANGGEHKDVRVEVDVNETAKKKIKIVSDGLSYINDNGEKYIIDNGERRAMSDEELAEYEKLVGGVGINGDIELELDESLADAHRVISIRSANSDQDPHSLSKIVLSLDGLNDLENLAELKGLHGLKGLEGLRDLKDLEVLKELHGIADIEVSPIAQAERELANALQSIEQATKEEKANKTQLEQSAKELKKLQKQLAKDQERIRKTREKARLAAKTAREKILEPH